MVRTDQATVVLDAGAIIGLARGSARLRGLVADAHRRGDEVSVPMAVIAETVRGNGLRDAAVNLTLSQFSPHRPLDEPTARVAGALLAAASSSATIDALVAAEALHRQPATVLTSDPGDLRQLLDGHSGVTVEEI